MKGKKSVVRDLLKKVLLSRGGKKYFVFELDKDYHTLDGKFFSSDLGKSDCVLSSDTGSNFSLFDPFFIDKYNKIERKAQIVLPKDLGFVISKTGVGKDSLVVDAGSGSGSAACLFGRVCKKVVSYEVKEEFFECSKRNVDFLGLDNVEVKNRDVFEGVDEKNVDLVFFDLKNPGKGLNVAGSCLKVGGFLVCYSMSLSQVISFCNSVRDCDFFCEPEVFEMVNRRWDVVGEKIRPSSVDGFHTGFLVFTRKL